ncbi:MAG: type II secretion system F family protein [Candidatus Sungbacteria bacterium]|nr:type II secretion system F family protein [Candidatus Sungbacteria bacterium]
MSQFNYKARTQEGEIREGVIDVVNVEAATDSLQKSGLIITSLQEVKKQGGGNFFLRFLSGSSVNVRDLSIFSRQIATLFDARVPVIRALKTLAVEAQSAVLQETIADVLDDVSGGSSLSLAMSKHPNIFSYFYVNMVRAGEETGKLQEVFNYLADYLERSHEIGSKIKNALIYPAFILAVFILVIVVMLIVVIPKLASIFTETDMAVPFYTQLVIGASSILRTYGIFLMILLVAGCVFLYRYFKTPSGKELRDVLVLKIPVFGLLFQKFYLSRIADNLSSLINSGVPIIRALQVTASVLDNRVYEEVVLDATRSIKSGNTIGAAFEQYEEIPPLMTQMIRIGEDSGRLDFILNALARFYKRDVDNMVASIVSLIEPALIVILGGGVGILVASILIPLYSLSSSIR